MSCLPPFGYAPPPYPRPPSSPATSTGCRTQIAAATCWCVDPVAETFRWMRPPPAAVEADAQAQALLELDGRLTMTLTRGDLATAELWVLQDYERHDNWACKLKIPLPPAADIVRDRPGAVAVVSPEGDVTVHCTDCLLQCDAKGRLGECGRVTSRSTIGSSPCRICSERASFRMAASMVERSQLGTSAFSILLSSYTATAIFIQDYKSVASD
ncbi:hypothetical protein C2845_PM09G24960 [Panicum miliaceum]|uniref:F-box associated domain-containing protein n=1 Tax=Panicum miliaceum TaxID=4540 RepID=A0A3L6S3W0_PANMI|nr:hypothetical protein C2845_PM09G24960 [Panicum miliaceum]